MSCVSAQLGTLSATYEMSLLDEFDAERPKRQVGLSEKQSAFLDWLLMVPKVPPTQKAWCEANLVTEGTVRTWRKQRKFLLEWERRAMEFNISVDRTQGVLDTLHSAAIRGDVNAAREYLKYVDKLMPPKQVDRDSSVKDLSDAELEAELKGLLAGE